MTAARSYYAFDVAPGFWDGLVQEARNGRLMSIDRIKEEIDRGKDDLKDWANNTFHAWFASTAENNVVATYRQIMKWAQAQKQFTAAAKAEFAVSADGWLVAYAKAKDCVVVTNEKFEPNIKRKIKIPNVCQAFTVTYVNAFEMLRALSIRLG